LSREPLAISLAVLAVLAIAAGGSWLVERPRPPAAVVQVGPAAPGERRVTLAVDGMTCRHCASGIEAELRATPGVVACGLDPVVGRAVVRCKAGTADSTLVQSVARAGGGFHATVVPL
jgi:copper chaperone CopZ